MSHFESIDNNFITVKWMVSGTFLDKLTFLYQSFDSSFIDREKRERDWGREGKNKNRLRKEKKQLNREFNFRFGKQSKNPQTKQL